MNQIIFVIDDEAIVAEGIANALACHGRTVYVCSDAESAEVLLESIRPHAILCDVRLTGPFRFEGLDILHHAARHAPEAAVVLMSGHVTPELRVEAGRRGARAVVEKPFKLSLIEQYLAACEEGTDEEVIVLPTLDEILASSALTPQFQPIVDLQRGGILGFESLARLKTSSPFANPEILFSYAARKQRVADLELACMARTFETAPDPGQHGLLFMNLHPAALVESDRLSALLQSESAARGILLPRVVLELTEQHQIANDARTHQAIDQIRALGVQFAFDDVGMAHSHLPHIDRVRPKFLKVSQHFGTGFELDSVRSRLVSNLLSLARDFDASLILEGIESGETGDAARTLGIPFGQGYFYSRPLRSSDASLYAAGNPGIAASLS